MASAFDITIRQGFRFGLLLAPIVFLTMVSVPAFATTIQDLCEVQGARGNVLRGVGIVVGLAGTGDRTEEAQRAQQRMLQRMDIEVDTLRNLRTDNAAMVIVTAVHPPFAKEGTRIDVQVSSLFNADSLNGGILLNTQLRGDDDRVYAVAQGPVSVGGFAVGNGGAGVQQNHPTVGRVPMGGYIEREIPSTITDGERIVLLLKRPDFATASNIASAVNDSLNGSYASAYGAGSINIRIPEQSQRDLVAFIADLNQIPVEASIPKRVVINERTGTVVVGGDVSVRPAQVAHGNITIEIRTTPVFPPPPEVAIGVEDPEAEEIVEIEIEEHEAYLLPVEGTSASEVAMALNKLRVTPRDMIAIFQALREAGALQAEIEVM